MIKDFLVINCTGKNDSILLKIDNKFFIKKIQTNLTKNEMLVLDIFNFLRDHNAYIDKNLSIIVNSGPGSFSGIRISLAVAKGLKLVKKINIYSYNYFLLSAAPYLKARRKIISIQKTNNFYYFSQGIFDNVYNFSLPRKVDFNKLKTENAVIVTSSETMDDEIINNIGQEKIKMVKFDLKNVDLLIENNLLEYKLIKPLYLS